MALIDTTQMRQGTFVEIGGDPHVIVSYQHVKPGKGGAFVRMRLKSLTSGAVLDKTIKSGETLPAAEIEKRQMQYLYDSGDAVVMMDQQSFDQVEIPRASIENADLMAENCLVEVLLHAGRPIAVELPTFVELEVAETDPPERGGKLKSAVLSSGATVQVPSFIARGEKLRIDTRERKYVERA
ncbi:MAG TPA: elongation factor P [Myxococcota bacterium]|nr:elongation factor P [Myxococcota bacterium]